MSEPREVELKLICDLADLMALPEWPPLKAASARSKDQLESVYFDTPDRSLQKAGYVLRVRKTSDGYVQTAKAGGDGLIERPEWERPVAGPEPDLDVVRTTPLGEVLGKKPKLAALFTVSVERATFIVAQGSSRIEVALDHGRVTEPGQRQRPKTETVCEVELELKQGSASDVFALARKLAKHVPVRLGVRSKAERGFDLGSTDIDGARKAEPVALSDGMTAADGFRAIAHACLRHMRLNEDILLDHRDADALHQARVAIRRLRSAFSLFRGLLGDAHFEAIKADLKRLSEPLGRARNLDVFLSETLPAERARHPDQVELLNLEKHLESERADAYAAVQQRLRSDEWRRYFVDLVSWINAGPWLDASGGDERDQPLVAFASGVLDKRRRQVKKRGGKLAKLSPEDRHQLRIAAKKLRYGAEFFSGLSTGKKARKRHKDFTSALSDLQGSLGVLNDIAAGQELLDGLVATEAGRSVGFAAGMTTADIDAKTKTKALLADAAQAHQELIESRPFWR